MYVYTVYYVSASGLAPVPLKTFDSMDKAKDFMQKREDKDKQDGDTFPHGYDICGTRVY